MPCRCDYMEPNKREKEAQLVCELLVFVNSTRFFKMGVSKEIVEGAKDPYCKSAIDDLDNLTATLCGLCKELEQSHRGRTDVLYDGRNPNSRKLADWWQKHQEMDKKREKEESEKVRLRMVRKNALAKLTDEERKTLGI